VTEETLKRFLWLHERKFKLVIKIKNNTDFKKISGDVDGGFIEELSPSYKLTRKTQNPNDDSLKTTCFRNFGLTYNGLQFLRFKLL
jgi:hypothetical protein